jgi:hypothetical protein
MVELCLTCRDVGLKDYFTYTFKFIQIEFFGTVRDVGEVADVSDVHSIPMFRFELWRWVNFCVFRSLEKTSHWVEECSWWSA